MQQDFNYYENLDTIVVEALQFLSETIDVNTIFFATNDQHTNFIRKAINRQAVLLRDGDEMPFQDVLCKLVIENTSEVLVIPDLKENERSKNHPVTQKVGNGCFLGIPIVLRNQETVGTLCAFDTVPHKFTAHEIQLMKMFGFLIQMGIQLEDGLIKDGLTQLYNRTFIQSFLHREKEALQNMSVIYIDFDNFKLVNDSFGHAIGDLVLVEVGRLLRLQLPCNSIVARIGGDEFVALLPNVAGDVFSETREVVTALVELFRTNPVNVAGKVPTLTVSIGVSFYPRDGADIDTLLKKSDSAMYLAKANGKNSAQFYEENRLVNTERLSKDKALKQALQNEHLHLYYQPQFDLKSNQFIGLEALLRWEHPEWGTLLPAEFLPIAERIGLIDAIGQWVLETSCKQALEWDKKGFPPFYLAVNLSPKQFQNKQLAEQILTTLQKTSFPPHRLKLEITEQSLLEDETASLKTIQALQAEGIGIAIDDFGSGYASLSYLNKFPIDMLKIDKSLTVHSHHPVGKKVLQTVIELAHSLNMLSVAEGIETTEQLEFLKTSSCQWGQGFYLGKPLPAHRVVELLQEKKDEK